MKIFIVRLLEILALAGSIVWFIISKDLEPIITFLTLLSSFIYLEFKKGSKSRQTADKKLFKRFKDDLPFYNISYIMETPLSSPTINEYLEPFFNFDMAWNNNVHYKFLHKGLEKRKQKLCRSISLLLSLFLKYTVHHPNPRLRWISDEWIERNPTKFPIVRNEFSKAQKEVIKNYNAFIWEVKHLLHI